MWVPAFFVFPRANFSCSSHISQFWQKEKPHLSCAEAPYQPWVLYTIIYDYHYCDHY